MTIAMASMHRIPVIQPDVRHLRLRSGLRVLSTQSAGRDGIRGHDEPAGQPEAGSEVDKAHGHPHEESREMLVVEGGQSPRLRVAFIPAVERAGRHDDEPAQQPAMHQRREGARQGQSRCVHPSAHPEPSARTGAPYRRRRHVQRVKPFPLHGRIEQRRRMPEPQRQPMQRRGRERTAQPQPGLGERPPRHGREVPPAPAPWKRPGERHPRLAEEKQHRCGGHQQTMLRHVRRQQGAAEPIERRDERNDEQRPGRARRRTRALARCRAIGRPAPRAAACRARIPRLRPATDRAPAGRSSRPAIGCSVASARDRGRPRARPTP